jgi:RNA polymerase sigma-70 factor (ECF subfamily)
MKQMDTGDAEQVARARVGDAQAYRGLVEAHGGRVFRIAFRITGNEADAEDAVQETFLKAYSRLEQFEPKAGFGAWIGRIAANTAIDLLRARRRRGRVMVASENREGVPIEAVAPGLPADRVVQGMELQDRVKGAMRRLTEKERAAFVLRHFEDQSIKEISEALSQSDNAIKQALFRAVRKLRVALATDVAASPSS